jgi:xanthine dehydrogenase YagS FAD-binding subunit
LHALARRGAVDMATVTKTERLAEFLAGGTDLMERRRSGVAVLVPQRLPLTDAMRSITWRADGGATIGAAVTIDRLARDAAMMAAYPGLALAAGGLATPEIRRMATVGGNLTQRSRCWYYRNHTTPCLKKGGDSCPARTGNHLYGVVFDLGSCVAPHPSTLGAALLAYDAVVMTSARPSLTLSDIFGDGRDGTRDHHLLDGEIVQCIHLPTPWVGERAHYTRAISRAHAEWPLAEIVLRLVKDAGVVQQTAVAFGGIAPVPVRLSSVEQALMGARVNALPFADLKRRASANVTPLPMTGYKVALIEGLLTEALEALVAGQ